MIRGARRSPIHGRITRATGGRRRAVNLSDVFGVWEVKGTLYVSLLRGTQEAIINIRPDDGAIYDLLRMLYRYGLSLP